MNLRDAKLDIIFTVILVQRCWNVFVIILCTYSHVYSNSPISQVFPLEMRCQSLLYVTHPCMEQFDPHPPLSVMLSENSTSGPLNRCPPEHSYTSCPNVDYIVVIRQTKITATVYICTCHLNMYLTNPGYTITCYTGVKVRFVTAWQRVCKRCSNFSCRTLYTQVTVV